MAVPVGPQPIPLVRDALEALAKDLLRGHVSAYVAGEKLKQLAGNLHRKPPIRVTRKKIGALSEARKIAIRETFRTNPELSQLEIANMYSTNPGRVSEALNELN